MLSVVPPSNINKVSISNSHSLFIKHFYSDVDASKFQESRKHLFILEFSKVTNKIVYSY